MSAGVPEGGAVEFVRGEGALLWDVGNVIGLQYENDTNTVAMFFNNGSFLYN